VDRSSCDHWNRGCRAGDGCGWPRATTRWPEVDWSELTLEPPTPTFPDRLRLDPERLVGNLHRAYLELTQPERPPRSRAGRALCVPGDDRVQRWADVALPCLTEFQTGRWAAGSAGGQVKIPVRWR
jgi:hypothetical protein